MADVVEQVPERPVALAFSGQRTIARARIAERSDAWRRASAGRELLILLLAPLVAIIPPHIPWVILVVGLAAYRAYGRLNERATLLSLRGPCPKCGTEQDFTELGRMRFPHTVTCASCRWELTLEPAPPSA